MEAPSASHVVRFGVFELDVDAGELRNAGVPVGVRGQPLQVLACLLERPGGLVTRDELRSRLWPADTFVDFDHGLNATIKRLRDALGDSADAPRFIETVPRRGYRFVATVEQPAAVAAVADPSPTSRGTEPAGIPPRPAAAWWRGRRAITWSWGAAVLVMLAAAPLAWHRLVSPPDAEAGLSMRVLPLVTLSGYSYSPSFSPDGGQVAFSRQDAGSTDQNIYVQLVGSTEVRQLTKGGTDRRPAWSPDGSRIAFLRFWGTDSRLYLTSPIGGAERQLSDLVAWGPISWSADGRYLAAVHSDAADGTVAAIWLVPSDGGQTRALTHPVRPEFHGSPAFSPDGRRLAYKSCGPGGCHVDVIELGSDLTPGPTPLRVTPQTIYTISAIAWSRDSRWLVFDAQNLAYMTRLMRVPADGSGPPVPIEAAGLWAERPAMDRTHDRLAFGRYIDDVDVYRVGRGERPAPVIDSSFADLLPEVSPDGARIAFCSERTGDAVEVWVAARDGSDARQLTHGPNDHQCSPHWSPDGKAIAFDSRSPDGHWHIWSVDSAGGTPRQVTRDDYSQNIPSWSHDGRWIYFASDHGMGLQAWRIGADGAHEQQLTHDGSQAYARESANGQDLLYQSGRGDSALLALPLAGGTARQLVACVKWSRFAVTGSRVYYVPCTADASNPEVRVLDTGSKTDVVFARIDRLPNTHGLAVSPDGNTVYFTRRSRESADLMLIEGFK